MLALAAFAAVAQPYTPSPENIASREKFAGFKFGIFIHWGFYSMMGDGEWVMNSQNLNYLEYQRLAAGFCPSKFSAKQWIDTFKDAGARYMTITTRHHDGFSMFDTDQTEFNIVDATPFGRDVIGELAKECKEQDFQLHFYYSHLDWGRTDYWPLGSTGHAAGRPEGKPGDWDHYIKFIEAQLTELVTKYHPGAIWFDGIWDKPGNGSRLDQYSLWKLREQYDLIHSLDPYCLVGNNHHQLPFPGEDMELFEKDVPGKNEGGFSGGQGVAADYPLETCQTMNNSWGYNINDKNYKSTEYLIQYLVKTAGKGANLLLNIGPRPDGTLPDEAVQRLHEMGEWLRIYGDAIYETEGGFIPEQQWGVTTQKGKELYMHILNYQDKIFLPVEGNKVVSASVFGTETKVPFTQVREGVVISVPSPAEKQIDQIITLKFKNDL